jgi:diamine N-acetyltransferase
MEIKKVTKKDLPALIDLARSTFIAAFAEQNDPVDFATYIASAFNPKTFEKEFYTEGSVFYLAKNDDELIGYFKLNHNKFPHDAINLTPEFELIQSNKLTELERIYLIENTHGKGFATLMMAEIIELSKAENSLFIWLGVWEYNLKAIKFYQKSGFTKFGEHIFEIGDDPQTDWLMWKKL